MNTRRYEARLNKKDEALHLQNKVSAEQTVNKIEALYGPFSEAEIEHYRKKLTRDGAPMINEFQRQLVGYMYDKDFGDPITMNAIHNQTDYIKLIIAAISPLKMTSTSISACARSDGSFFNSLQQCCENLHLRSVS